MVVQDGIDVRDKKSVSELAIMGGKALFNPPISTSNLYEPSLQRIKNYSSQFIEAKRYTNGGPLVIELEKRLAAFHGVKYCVAVSNGFWALVLTIKSLALEGLSEVVVPSLTYRRMADVIAWAGLTPYFVDVDATTLAIDTESIISGITSQTALILAVHPIVNTCDASGIESLARRLELPILFDSVESVYESVDGRKVGSFGDAECFSLHASKLINGFEGGYITTNDQKLAEELRLSRAFGFEKQDVVKYFGMNAKLNEMHAAVALASLDELEMQVEHNRNIYGSYLELTSNLAGIRLVPFSHSGPTSYKNIIFEVDDSFPFTRDQLVQILNSEGILARAYYNPPLHLKSYSYRTLASPAPVSEWAKDRFVLLPSGYRISVPDVVKVMDLIRMLSYLSVREAKSLFALWKLGK